MKTIIPILIALVLISSSISSYAVDITFTIPNDKVDRIKTPLFEKYPKATSCPPVSPTSTPCTVNPTDLQHFKQIVIDIMKKTIQDIENKQLRKDANSAKGDYIRNNRPTDYEELFQ